MKPWRAENHKKTYEIAASCLFHSELKKKDFPQAWKECLQADPDRPDNPGSKEFLKHLTVCLYTTDQLAKENQRSVDCFLKDLLENPFSPESVDLSRRMSENFSKCEEGESKRYQHAVFTEFDKDDSKLWPNTLAFLIEKSKKQAQKTCTKDSQVIFQDLKFWAAEVTNQTYEIAALSLLSLPLKEKDFPKAWKTLFDIDPDLSPGCMIDEQVRRMKMCLQATERMAKEKKELLEDFIKRMQDNPFSDENVTLEDQITSDLIRQDRNCPMYKRKQTGCITYHERINCPKNSRPRNDKKSG